jgi:leader peptidase (prepilin peptidase) / N-methyltransferase
MESLADIFLPRNGATPLALHVLAFVLGATIGSFLNVVIVRLPAGMSVVRPRSHCPRCGDMIPGWLNVPILSWIILRGRCRKCRLPISIRYPVVELLTAVLFLAALVTFGLSLATIAAMLLSAGLVVITFIDIDIWEIPDEVSLPGILIGAALRPFAFGAPWYDGVLGAALGAGSLALIRWIYFLIRKTEGMGLGDLKLLAMIGAFLGAAALLPTVLVASAFGSVVGIALLLFGKKPAEPPPPPPETEKKEGDEEDDWVPPPNALPFGPFLALGGLTQLFLGSYIWKVLLGE